MVKAKATFLGHAIHPMAVTLPLGSAPLAILFDALYLWDGASAWALAAFVATLVAMLGIILASIPGTIDLMSVVPREGPVWKTATNHLALGWTLGGYYVVFSVLRWFALPEPGGWVPWALLGGNLLGFGLMLLQGYWGGDLVERYHIGMHDGPPEEVGPDATRKPMGLLKRLRRGRRITRGLE